MLGRIDLALRFLYVIAIPSMLGALSGVAPIGGIVIGTGLATAVALIGTRRWRDSVERIPVLGRPLASFGSLGEYYADSPPKPLLYYLLYPALFPFLVFTKNGRREFLLYRNLNLIVVAIIAVAGLVEYFAKWQPLPFESFFGMAVGLFFIQLVLLAMMVMPIVTTILIFHRNHHPRWLKLLLVLAALSGALGVSVRHKVKGLPFDVQERLKARTELFHADATAALRDALDAARTQPDPDRALDAARTALQRVYRAEADAFQLWTGDGVTMIYARTNKAKYVWLARDATHVIDDAAQLPAAARAILAD